MVKFNQKDPIPMLGQTRRMYNKLCKELREYGSELQCVRIGPATSVLGMCSTCSEISNDFISQIID